VSLNFSLSWNIINGANIPITIKKTSHRIMLPRTIRNMDAIFIFAELDFRVGLKKGDNPDMIKTEAEIENCNCKNKLAPINT